jgi:hypothetical protein
MDLVERLRRQATILGFTAAVIAVLFVVVAVVPFNLLALYLVASFLTLGFLSLKSSRFGEGKSGALAFFVGGVGMFLFVAVGVISLRTSNDLSALASAVGVLVVMYGMSL